MFVCLYVRGGCWAQAKKIRWGGMEHLQREAVDNTLHGFSSKHIVRTGGDFVAVSLGKCWVLAVGGGPGEMGTPGLGGVCLWVSLTRCCLVGLYHTTPTAVFFFGLTHHHHHHHHHFFVFSQTCID